MRKGSVAVVGCGWLGFTLAQNLLSDGYEVYGSTTSAEKLPQLEAAGIKGTVLQLPLVDFNGDANINVEDVGKHEIWRAEQLVLSIPPGRGTHAVKHYPAAVLSAILAYRRAQSSGRIIFTSSTGIYGEAHGKVTVQTAILGESERVASLALAESQIISQSQRPYAILRLAGLYGGERHPGYHLAGKKNISDGDAPVNLVSRKRVIGAIQELLDKPFWTSHIRNVVDPEHPSKRDFYTAFAKTHGLELPEFLPGGANGKVVI